MFITPKLCRPRSEDLVLFFGAPDELVKCMKKLTGTLGRGMYRNSSIGDATAFSITQFIQKCKHGTFYVSRFDFIIFHELAEVETYFFNPAKPLQTGTTRAQDHKGPG